VIVVATMGKKNTTQRGEKANGGKGKASASSLSSSKAKKKRENAKKKRNGQKYLEDLLEIYMKPELKDLEETRDEDSDEDGTSLEADMKVNVKDEILLCAKEACKRKRGGRAGPCVKNFCFLCCHESREKDAIYCPGHYKMSQQKETEDRYIAEGLNLKKPLKTKFYHYEEKFANYNQTVTVWCARDFFVNKEYSGDVLSDVSRDRRSRLMLQRRNGVLPAESGAKSSSSYSNSSKSSQGRLRPGRSGSSGTSGNLASKKENDKGGPEPDLSDSVVVRGWQALRTLHAQESKQRFDAVLAAFRRRCGEDMDSTAFLLE
jgi:hypothetical protein